MSFAAAYHPFMTVRTADDGGGAVTAFRFQPSDDCVRRLGDHRLTFRPRADGFQLYYRTNPLAATALVGAIGARTRFGFEMRIADAGFFNAFHPDLDATTGPQLLLDNLDGAGAVQAGGSLAAAATVEQDDAGRIVRRVHDVAVDMAAPAPTALTVAERFGGVAEPPIPVPATTAATQLVAIDLRKAEGVAFTIAETPPSPPARAIYADDRAAGLGLAGVVDLYWETAQDTVPAGGLTFDITFRRR